MPTTMKFLLTSLIVATAAVQAGPWNPQHVSANAKWTLHVDLDGLRETRVGKELADRLEAEHGRQFRALKRMFSVNPLTDLAGITLYGSGAENEAVALIDGRFDRAHIEDVIGGADDYRNHRHGDATVHQWTDKDKGKTQFAAFAGDQRIVFSEREELVHHALDVLAGKAGAAAEVPFFGSGPGRPVMAGFARLAEIEMKGEESKLLRKAEALRMAVAEADGRMQVRIAIDAAKPKTAQRMHKVIEGLVAFGELAELIKGELEIESRLANEELTVETALSMPVGEFLDLLEKDAKMKANKEKQDE